ncbi:sensor histidine kinase [Actinomadura parmotrematis]|uniref:histidine kinase n=1 Tax=Actinomadura parmotrematis TaxID=2864039 RepID=A0ABS7FNH2_9ACTN|nr:HAMP domain-containing sensor histidine kinase [Actinomadura parmotrematis]MBW8481925.1 HAMP domain-containing histidine kinase [Actinomadura parmotrematis]
MTLNARLLAGLLAVALTGLAVMGLVSGLVLHGYLMHRVDGQLAAARDRAVARLLRPGLPEEGVAPARFVVLNVSASGRVRPLSGADPDPSAAVRAVQDMGAAGLARHAAAMEPFGLPGLRAVARPTARGGAVVVAAPLDEIDAAVRNLLLAEAATALVLLALLAAGGRGLIRRGLRPLGRMAATAGAIAAGGDLGARMPDPGGRTETGRLAAAINVMLDRIEEAFRARGRSEARVREFAADASHELRTPLTTIQGYAELYRHGALGPDELPEAMGRIEAEAQRMDRLVTDLLALARLDREAALARAPADLAALARDAVRDARAAGPHGPIALDAPASLVAAVDEGRVRQVLANLLGNVRAHTPPGTPATVRIAGQDGAAVIEVADEGPGMPAEDAARAFERFHRAAASGGTGAGTGGAGLGLPIVAAIAAAHGGTAALRSAPGAGTAVRVTLPFPPHNVT